MDKVLITGGAGFIGSHIADKFDEKNYEIIIYNMLIFKNFILYFMFTVG